MKPRVNYAPYILRKPEDFYTYIKTEVQAFLKGE